MLYCRIHQNGTKTFVFRYKYHGRASHLGLGKYPDTSLKMARIKALEYRQLLSKDINPLFQKNKEKQKQENNLSKIADEWFRVKRQNYAPSTQ